MALTPGEISWIITEETEKAARSATETREVPRSRIDGCMLHLEWLGQTRSFVISGEATAEWLTARIAATLAAMLASGTHPRSSP